MRLALVGDIHTHRLFVPPWELLGKALVGQANVWFNRRRHFDLSLLPAVLARVEEIKPDMLLFSGDFTSIATAAEFAQLARTLGPIMERIPSVAVPGNHDRYTGAATRGRRMERAFPGVVPEIFPHMRVLNSSWRLLAIDTAVPNLFSSRGKMGSQQLAEVREMTKSLSPSDGLIILTHYPFVGPPPNMPPIKPNHELSDGDGLLYILRDLFCPMVFIHGHIHQPWCLRRLGDNLIRFIDLNAGAPCQISPAFPFGQGFWQIDLPESPAVMENVVFTHHTLETGLKWTSQSTDK